MLKVWGIGSPSEGQSNVAGLAKTQLLRLQPLRLQPRLTL